MEGCVSALDDHGQKALEFQSLDVIGEQSLIQESLKLYDYKTVKNSQIFVLRHDSLKTLMDKDGVIARVLLQNIISRDFNMKAAN